MHIDYQDNKKVYLKNLMVVMMPWKELKYIIYLLTVYVYFDKHLYLDGISVIDFIEMWKLPRYLWLLSYSTYRFSLRVYG